MASGLIAGDVHTISGKLFTQSRELQAKIRYRSEPVKVSVVPFEARQVRVLFDKPQRAVTPGQSIVFYDDDEVIGGGIIQESNG